MGWGRLHFLPLPHLNFPYRNDRKMKYIKIAVIRLLKINAKFDFEFFCQWRVHDFSQGREGGGGDKLEDLSCLKIPKDRNYFQSGLAFKKHKVINISKQV